MTCRVSLRPNRPFAAISDRPHTPPMSTRCDQRPMLILDALRGRMEAWVQAESAWKNDSIPSRGVTWILYVPRCRTVSTAQKLSHTTSKRSTRLPGQSTCERAACADTAVSTRRRWRTSRIGISLRSFCTCINRFLSTLPVSVTFVRRDNPSSTAAHNPPMQRTVTASSGAVK